MSSDIIVISGGWPGIGTTRSSRSPLTGPCFEAAMGLAARTMKITLRADLAVDGDDAIIRRLYLTGVKDLKRPIFKGLRAMVRR